MPVVLVVDEYHLDIHAEGDLISRYYLADVEVARDIAERFILFLGDDEMEFLADDALRFAYDGVAAMQEAWLAAQKRKRKHKKAADQSARRKDEEVQEAAVAASRPRALAEGPGRLQRTRPVNIRPPDAPPSELAKRIAAATRAEEAARQAMVKVEPLPEAKLPLEPKQAETLSDTTKTPDPEREPELDPVIPEVVEKEPSTEVEAASNGFHADVVDLDQVEKPPVELLSRPSQEESDLASEPPAPKGPAVIPTIAFTSQRLDQAPTTTEEEEGVRFAAAGHHPAETNVGLLSRLRRQPKVPDNHTHKFRESGSGVGLVRRVCTECSYVSIGSGD
ncbi:MAG TPA: hypothetical protein VM470_09210 [Acidimicrobiia bacterium]|nr:hypothetical protein [Acidimicrobiia bacterium]